MEYYLIGYKLKDDCKQYEKAACEISFGESKTGFFGRCHFEVNSPAESRLQIAGVLDLWFDRVYNDEHMRAFEKGKIEGFNEAIEEVMLLTYLSDHSVVRLFEEILKLKKTV